jgi:hypothetical protein
VANVELHLENAATALKVITGMDWMMIVMVRSMRAVIAAADSGSPVIAACRRIWVKGSAVAGYPTAPMVRLLPVKVKWAHPLRSVAMNSIPIVMAL